MTRLTRRRALLIGNEHYADARYGRLPSTQVDVWQLDQVLRNRNIGAFTSVETAHDLTADDMCVRIAEFLDACDPEELALLYVSGHGARLAAAGGEFHFIARDTDFDNIAATAVSASFVGERLEACWAQQKIAMLDCCSSGGFAVGLRTHDRKERAAKSAAPPETVPLTSRGVYVLSSSRAGEDSLAGAVTPEEIQPSDFTGEMVEALRTGKVGKDGSGEVSVDDLFHYVNKRMRMGKAQQVPVHSAHAVDDRLILASCPLGRAPELTPFRPRPEPGPSQLSTAEGKSGNVSRDDSLPQWSNLLDYYRNCLLSENANTPLMSVTEEGTSYVCLQGTERFLSGEVDPDGGTTLPPEAAELVETAQAQDAQLWAGYPAVTVNSTGRPRFTPLLVRRVETTVGEEDETRLLPCGPVLPHPRLAREHLGEEEAAELAATYQPTWHAGQHDRMAVDVKNLLMQDYELPCVQEPAPDQLAERIDVRTPGHGARNAAVLYLAPRSAGPTKKLLADFDAIARKTHDIPATALAALSPHPADRTPPPQAPQAAQPTLATPLASNEAQAGVLHSAMTHRLTVATGPPGTGKSQLVANLVATAVTSGQSVLVASTNNRAVDEVWQRCEQLTPGCLVRTGSASGETNYAEEEADTLRRLITTPPPEHNIPTARANLRQADDRVTHARQALAHTAHTERDLLAALQNREQHAHALQQPAADLETQLAPRQDLERLAARAQRLAHTRLFGRLRRKRLLRQLGLTADNSDPSA